MKLTQGELTMLMTAINGYRAVVGNHGKTILEEIGRSIGYQVRRQDDEVRKTDKNKIRFF
jgi:hypothetical protein